MKGKKYNKCDIYNESIYIICCWECVCVSVYTYKIIKEDIKRERGKKKKMKFKWKEWMNMNDTVHIKYENENIEKKMDDRKWNEMEI